MRQMLVTTITLIDRTNIPRTVATSVLTFDTAPEMHAALQALRAYTPEGVRRIIEVFD